MENRLKLKAIFLFNKKTQIPTTLERTEKNNAVVILILTQPLKLVASQKHTLRNISY